MTAKILIMLHCTASSAIAEPLLAQLTEFAVYRVNKKTYHPVTFVDISAVDANFCVKFYVTVKQ